jgi:hypothetical protein
MCKQCFLSHFIWVVIAVCCLFIQMIAQSSDGDRTTEFQGFYLTAIKYPLVTLLKRGKSLSLNEVYVIIDARWRTKNNNS